ncbi:hypothetical protein E2562_036714 [Oryza meyeriana var. granulata]|uniref:Uncharacterized protein n=1 Tax=Oryza meyeriana var. granulata TaxID=110450 RepID=A0A6G1CJR7_9ORYZ|nr:hypothetical protein E2562_036714 [Oryza meyeriana var. granulata]
MEVKMLPLEDKQKKKTRKIMVMTQTRVNKKEGHLEGETKKGDADDRKKEQLPDAEKAEDCLEVSKKQQEGQLPAAAQSTPNYEEEEVGDYPFLARQSTPSIMEDVPTFNLGFDNTQETAEEVTITSEHYGSFTTENYEWVGREADETIAKKALKDYERERIEIILNKKEIFFTILQQMGELVDNLSISAICTALEFHEPDKISDKEQKEYLGHTMSHKVSQEKMMKG